jgi:acyl-CoA synthetase (AMP-forming)/AMP-acid ligase II
MQWFPVYEHEDPTAKALALTNYYLLISAAIVILITGSLPAPTVRLSRQRMLDEETLEIGNDLHPNRQSGELVPAYVVLKSGQTFRSDELIAYCRQFLANCKIPRRVEFSETELPKSGSGKILKRILRERYWAHQERVVS